MAVDEALLQCAARAGPTLRLYTWSRPAVSLGYRQPAPRWIDRARAGGFEVVRRVTGGGAVLHAGDLTYAVVAPLGVPRVPDDLLGSCHWIRAALLEALSGLGLDVRPASGRLGADRLALCFAGATGLEIELLGRKLVGSAQRRTAWGFLQHGSIRLRDDSALYAKLLAPVGPAPRGTRSSTSPARERGATVRAPEPLSVAGLAALAPVDAKTVMDAIEGAFARRADSALVSAPLSDAERHLARTRASLRLNDDLARLPLASSGAPRYADSSF
jgi:lipoate-protein ligase A